MKNLIVIILSVVVVGGLVVGGYSLINRSETNDQADNTQSEVNKESETSKGDKEESFFGSMQDLITRGKPLKCTYKQKDSDEEYEITMYISGGNVRTEAEMKIDDGKIMESNMVINKDWMYMWNSFTPNGMKVDMQKMPKQENLKDSDVNKSMANLAKEMDYKCRAWIPDNSKFKIPTNIEFQDITEMMVGTAEEIGDMTEEDMKELQDESNKWICDHCKNAPTPELRAECLGDIVCE